MRIPFVIVFVSVYFLLSGQIPDRYKQEVFTDVVETVEKFSSGVPQPINAFDFYSFITGYPLNVKEYNTRSVDLNMDIFEPQGDILEKRPLVVLCFGGGFLSGSRKHWSIRLIATALAKMGYVTASIDYRLGMNIYDKDLGTRSVYRAVQDSRSAIRFFKADAASANKYNIDTNYIFIGGHSAGSFVGLHNLYLDKDIERPISTRAWMQDGRNIPDLNCLDCVGGNQSFNGQATGVFSLAGAIGFLDFIENGQEPPPVLFHSTDDATVPYNSGEPFSDVSILVIGSDLPIVQGSLPISQRCNALGIENQFYSYTNRGHSVHENGTSALHADIMPGISDWFFEKYIKPASTHLIGEKDLCTYDLIQNYQLLHTDMTYFNWVVTGGTITVADPTSNEIEVSWDSNAPVHEVSVLPYACNGAPGEIQEITVNLHADLDNKWLGGSGSWNDESKWSNGRAPISCEHIIFPAESSMVEITVDASTVATFKSLEIGSNVQLIIPLTADLEVSGN